MNAEGIPASTRRSGGIVSGLVKLLLALVLLVALWTWFTLSWSYSDGDRGGVLQKFSRKGWVCKTYEGELAMYVVAGVAPQIWQFSARDPKVAAQLASYVGERVQLHYTEHVGIPTNCFGETQYFVDRVSLAPGTAPGPVASPSPVSPSPAPVVPAATPGSTALPVQTPAQTPGEIPAPPAVPAGAPPAR